MSDGWLMPGQPGVVETGAGGLAAIRLGLSVAVPLVRMMVGQVFQRFAQFMNGRVNVAHRMSAVPAVVMIGHLQRLFNALQFM